MAHLLSQLQSSIIFEKEILPIPKNSTPFHVNLTSGSTGSNKNGRSDRCGQGLKKSLTIGENADICISMALEKVLRELVKERGLRKTSRDLGVDSGSLCRSLKDGSNLKLSRIEQLLDYFGFDLKLIKRKEVKTDNKGRLSQDGNPKRR